MTSPFDFPHLHVHSAFSFGDGADPPAALCAAARSASLRTLALTDTNSLAGAVAFVDAAHSAGLRPILGAQLKAGRARAVALALDAEGFATLCRLVTARHAAGPGFDLEDALARNAPGVALLADDPRLLDTLRARRGAEDLYVELWPRGRLPMAHRRRLLRFATESGLPPVVTLGVHFATAEGYPRHRARRARERGCPEGDLPADAVASPQAWLWPAPRVAAGTDDCPEALWNTLALAERCEAGLQLGRLRPPRAAILQGVDAVPTLRERCERALRRRFPGRIPRAHRRRLVKELSLLASSGLSGALLVVAALADHGRARAVPVQARGSAAASLVLHLLDVAPLDPVTHGLSFERFVEPGRAAPPDVDLDAGWDGRAALLHHLETVLGGDHALRAARLVREDSGAPGPGLPTGIATHPSAVALLPQGGRAQVPLQPTPDGAGVVAQWDARALRRAGYFVVDVLGNRALAALHQLHRSPRGDGPREPRGPAALLQDEPTATLVRTGRTLGCYHLESPPLRELLRRLGTHELDALIAAAALIRPGARRSGLVDQLLRAVRHRAAWQGQPDLLVFEEDLRRATRRLAGYEREASDRLLSALRRTRGGEPDAPLRQAFLDACRARGTPAATAERCWDQAATFSGASSSRAHCATAVHLGLRAAWWRAHHPAAFFAALLTHGGGYYTREVYLQEARREGLRLRPPCVNRGEAEFAPADNGRGVRLGWAQIRGLRAAAVRSIGDARRGGPFRSEADLARRAGLAPPDLDALARAGALPEQDPHRTDRSDAMLPLGTTGPHEAQEQRWRQEVAAYGVLLTAHPLDLVAPQLPGGLVPAADLARFAGARVGVAGWLVSVKTILDRSGHAMSFATFDHPSGLFDAALFPDVHQRCGARLAQSPGPWVIYGRVEDEPLAQALRAEDLVEVVPNAAPHPRCNHAK